MTIASILDPCYKFKFADWAYRKIYVSTHHAQLGLLKDKLFTLYDEYANSSNLASTFAPSSTPVYFSPTMQCSSTNELFEVSFFSMYIKFI